MSNNNNHQLGEAPWLHVIISTGFGTGFFPWGPGTFGGFIALLVWIRFLFSAFARVALRRNGSVGGGFALHRGVDRQRYGALLGRRSTHRDNRRVLRNVDGYAARPLCRRSGMASYHACVVGFCALPHHRHHQTAWLPMGRPQHTRRLGLHAGRRAGCLLCHNSGVGGAPCDIKKSLTKFGLFVKSAYLCTILILGC